MRRLSPCAAAITHPMIADGRRLRASRANLADLLDCGLDVLDRRNRGAADRLLSLRALHGDRRRAALLDDRVPFLVIAIGIPLFDVRDTCAPGDARQEGVGHVAGVLAPLF